MFRRSEAPVSHTCYCKHVFACLTPSMFASPGLEQQYLIPVKPGWFRIDDAAPAATQPFTAFTPDSVWEAGCPEVYGTKAPQMP